MKKLIAILLSIALLVMTTECAGGDTEPTENKSHPKPTEITEATKTTEATKPDRSVELVGTWERTQTEVEEYVEETPAGQVTVQITGSSEDNLLISYQDKEFPDDDYSDKALFIIPNGDLWWYGDVEWFAQVNHTGNFGQTFTMAIVDDMLVIQNYFEVDGAPCVSYETFRRVN